MAKLFPDVKTIKKLKPLPTCGEIACLNFLKNTLSDDFEIYFQPFVNGDNPDIVVVNKKSGILIIEVKDWDFDNYLVDENDNWKVKNNNSCIKSPLEQVKKYKNNFFDLHIPTLLGKQILNKKIYSTIRTAVYFHNETKDSIFRFIKKKDKYVDLLGKDSLTKEAFSTILEKRWLNRRSPLFTDELYNEFKRFLQPSIHTLEQGVKINYTEKQKELSISRDNKQQKIKGFAGSGKTIVLAKRAVNAHKRTGKKVLVLTFNIALRNYIHDCISKVREEFEWKYFHIDSYHNFINSQTNNLNVKIKNLSDYNNLGLFKGCESEIVKYDAIFIDEIQDYKEEWIKIIKNNFLTDNGEFVVFGDEKQNIYERRLDSEKKPNTTIPGRWAELNESYRLSDKITHLSTRFQNNFFSNKYELDKIQTIEQKQLFSEENIEHYFFNKQTSVSLLLSKIFQIIKQKNIHPNDICFLSSKIEILRDLDYRIRHDYKEKTKKTFEGKRYFEKLKEENSDLYKLKIKLEAVRKNQKFNFWMNPGTMKLSTIYSFKGWEIPTLFLIIDPKESNDELIYTAITRCRHNLFIINIDNLKYKKFFEEKDNFDLVEKPSITQELPNQIKEREKQEETIEDIEEQGKKLELPFVLNSLKNKNSKFKICVLGEIAESKSSFEEKIGSFFNKYNVKVYHWDVDFINNKKLKNSNILKSLKKGQSSYSLIVTGQIHHHSNKGNQEANLLEELKKEKYIDSIFVSMPQKKMTADSLLEKLDEYLDEKRTELQ